MLKKFKDLTEREILAIAIANEEEDGRIYGEFADALRESYPATADMFEEMRVEEAGHRDRLAVLIPQPLWRANPSHSPRRRQGLSEAPPGLDDASARRKGRASPG